MEIVRSLLKNRPSAALSAALRLTLNAVLLVISTPLLVNVRESPPSPLRLSLLTSMSLVAPM